MKSKTVFGLIAMAAIVSVMIFVGCIEKKTTPTPVPTPLPTPLPTPTPTITPIETTPIPILPIDYYINPEDYELYEPGKHPWGVKLPDEPVEFIPRTIGNAYLEISPSPAGWYNISLRADKDVGYWLVNIYDSKDNWLNSFLYKVTEIPEKDFVDLFLFLTESGDEKYKLTAIGFKEDPIFTPNRFNERTYESEHKEIEISQNQKIPTHASTPSVTPKATLTPVVPTPTPLGFEAIFAIVGLLAVAYLIIIKINRNKRR